MLRVRGFRWNSFSLRRRHVALPRVLRCIAHVYLHCRSVLGWAAAAVAKGCSLQQWPELLQFAFQCTQSPLAEHREVALQLFVSLMEHMSNVSASRAL